MLRLIDVIEPTTDAVEFEVEDNHSLAIRGTTASGLSDDGDDLIDNTYVVISAEDAAKLLDWLSQRVTRQAVVLEKD